MTEYALFFESGGPVFGEGYIASVRVHGRLLATRDMDDGEFQLNGVNPGSLLGFGGTLNEAYQHLVESLRCILIDIASAAPDFDAFCREARDFFDTDDPRARARWDHARDSARRGDVRNDLDLRVERSIPDLGIFITQVETPSVEANAPAQHLAPSAIAA
jgi:hypothetical protein